MFMAEKGIDMPKQTVDLRGGENRQADISSVTRMARCRHSNSMMAAYLSEITAICEYLEEKNPKPAMIGSTPEERAECRMWTRRVDLNICEHACQRLSLRRRPEVFRKADSCAPEASPGLKMIAANRLQWLNGQMAGKEYLCGKRFYAG